MSLGISAGNWLVAGATVGSAMLSADAAGNAADAQAGAADAAGQRSDRQYDLTRADNLRQYNQVRADQAPYREAGNASLAQLASGVKTGGEYARSFGMDDYQADPGYQFRLEQGQKGINNAASARGGQYSGATLKALANFNSGLASQEYGNAYSRFNTDQTTKFNRNATLAGIGQTANTAIGNAGANSTNAITSAGMNNANNQGQYLQNAGEARASGYVGKSNAIGSGIKQLYDGYQQRQALDGFQNSNRSMNLSPSDLYSAF
jgi:hypothetical protein